PLDLTPAQVSKNSHLSASENQVSAKPPDPSVKIIRFPRTVQPQPSAPQEPSLVEAELRFLRQQVEQLVANAPAQNKPKPDPFTFLPPIQVPANCRMDYPKYDGTGDPARHVRTFRSYARLYAHDSALMAYLFQFALEGEP